MTCVGSGELYCSGSQKLLCSSETHRAELKMSVYLSFIHYFPFFLFYCKWTECIDAVHSSWNQVYLSKRQKTQHGKECYIFLMLFRKEDGDHLGYYKFVAMLCLFSSYLHFKLFNRYILRFQSVLTITGQHWFISRNALEKHLEYYL